MGTFTPRVMRLLSDELTGTPVREIDALFDDRDIALGPPQPRENDESVRRERMRRHLVTMYPDSLRAGSSVTAAVLRPALRRLGPRPC